MWMVNVRVRIRAVLRVRVVYIKRKVIDDIKSEIGGKRSVRRKTRKVVGVDILVGV